MELPTAIFTPRRGYVGFALLAAVVLLASGCHRGWPDSERAAFVERCLRGGRETEPYAQPALDWAGIADSREEYCNCVIDAFESRVEYSVYRDQIRARNRGESVDPEVRDEYLRVIEECMGVDAFDENGDGRVNHPGVELRRGLLDRRTEPADRQSPLQLPLRVVPCDDDPTAAPPSTGENTPPVERDVETATDVVRARLNELGPTVGFGKRAKPSSSICQLPRERARPRGHHSARGAPGRSPSLFRAGVTRSARSPQSTPRAPARR